jgi:two-component system alkaline phosphatase synthesis response regulator PhoP
MNYHKTSPAGGIANARTRREIDSPYRILVVDDHDYIRHFISTFLIHSGYLVDTAENGATAWDMLQIKSYDLLVTDNDMPRVSGIELLGKLHAVSMTLPVIMATGTSPEEELTQNPWLQPAAMLLKPFSGSELTRAVERVLHVTDRARYQLCSIC